MNMPKRSLESMVEANDYPPDVADRLIRAVRDNGTEEDIVAGRKVLPHPEDAQRWHDAETAREDRERGRELRRQNPPSPTSEPPASLHDQQV